MKRSTSWWRASSGEALTLALLLAGCSTRDVVRPAPVPTEPKQVTVFFSTELRGYITPCGCSQNMRGGISRAAFPIEEARKEGHPVHVVAGGDGVFGTALIPPEAVAQQERKAKALAEAWKQMGLDVRTIGPLDDARGVEFRRSLGLPELGFGDVKVMDGIGVVTARDVASANAAAAKAREAGAKFVAVLVPTTFAALLRDAANAKGMELLIATESGGEFAAEDSRFVGGAVKVAQIQSKGRSLLRVDVFLRDDGAVEWLRGGDERDRELAGLDERIELLRAQVNEPMLNEQMRALRSAKLEEIIQRRATLAATPLPVPDKTNAATARFVPIESTVPKSSTIAAIETAYDADVGRLNLAYAKENGVSCEPATKERPGIVGSATCVACHVEEGKVWQQTKHPQAYKAIEEVGKQFHLDCVSCHVTGWKLPQGVCRIDQTEGRAEVGCESCHGAGSAHVANPKKGTITRVVGASTCTGCHDRENSPHFDFDTYVEKILGPGHGR